MNVRPAIVFRAAALSALALVAACGKTPGWSAEERQNARELCLTQVGESFELSKAQAYCGCLVAKTIQEFPTYAEADKLGTGKDGDRLGDECVEELHLTERDAPSGSASADPGSLRPQSSVATEPRTYGDWHVIFEAGDPSNDEVDTWQAVTSDETSGALLAYVCEPGGCGLLLEPETHCDNGQTARFSCCSRKTIRRASSTPTPIACRTAAWAFESLDPILDAAPWAARHLACVSTRRKSRFQLGWRDRRAGLRGKGRERAWRPGRCGAGGTGRRARTLARAQNDAPTSNSRSTSSICRRSAMNRITWSSAWISGVVMRHQHLVAAHDRADRRAAR